MNRVFITLNNKTILFNVGMSVVPRNGEILQMPYQFLDYYNEVKGSKKFNSVNDCPHYGLVYNKSDIKELPTPYIIVKKVVHCIYSDYIALECDFFEDGTEDK